MRQHQDAINIFLRMTVLGDATDAVIAAYGYRKSYSASESKMYREVSTATEQAFPVGNRKQHADALERLLDSREDQ